jgi:hypothetical protein
MASIEEREKRRLAEMRVKQLENIGSGGVPSCGVTDAKLLGQGGDGETYYIGGSDEEIPPGTLRSFFLFLCFTA